MNNEYRVDFWHKGSVRHPRSPWTHHNSYNNVTKAEASIEYAKKYYAWAGGARIQKLKNNGFYETIKKEWF